MILDGVSGGKGLYTCQRAGTGRIGRHQRAVDEKRRGCDGAGNEEYFLYIGLRHGSQSQHPSIE
jgi:hypothetical protein